MFSFAAQSAQVLCITRSLHTQWFDTQLWREERKLESAASDGVICFHTQTSHLRFEMEGDRQSASPEYLSVMQGIILSPSLVILFILDHFDLGENMFGLMIGYWLVVQSERSDSKEAWASFTFISPVRFHSFSRNKYLLFPSKASCMELCGETSLRFRMLCSNSQLAT